MKIHRGFPPKLDWLKIEESNCIINLTTHNHKVSMNLIWNGQTVVGGLVSFDDFYKALLTIKLDPSIQ